MYDLEINNRRHSYIVGGALVHNSAAGSLVSYLLGIVKVNPLEYDLLFSRFLTKGRLVRHETEEIIKINGEKEISSNDFVKIERGGEEMIVKAKELQEGDKLIEE